MLSLSKTTTFSVENPCVGGLIPPRATKNSWVIQNQKQVKQGLRDLTTQEKQFMSFLSALSTEGQTCSTQDYDQLVMRKFLPFFTLLGLFYPYF